MPRCEDCVGEDGGDPAPALANGSTVAWLETAAPDASITEFVLRGTVPVPPHTFPRGDGRNPFVVLDWDGAPLATQTELVSRYADESLGADVVEVLAKVHRDPGVALGTQVRYEVVQSPGAVLGGAGTVNLGDLEATASVPAAILDLLHDPNGIEIRTYDCFGNKYVCRPLDGTGTYELMRRGSVTSELRIYQTMQPEPSVAGPSGTLPHFFGVHAYVSTLTGQEIVGLALRFNNASSGRDGASALDDPLDAVYFREIEVRLPAGLSLMQDFADPYLGAFVGEGGGWVWDLVEPLSGNDLHVMKWQGQFHRRLWISTAAANGPARNYANGFGQGFCVRGTDPAGHDWWSWWNKGTARYFPQKYQLPSLDHVGRANLRASLLAESSHLAERLANGTSDGDYPIAAPVLGWGHPYGTAYGGMTGGNEIFLFEGVPTAAAASVEGYRMYTALHRMHSDRQPNALYDLDGEPTSVERWLVDYGNRDYVPFYCFITPYLGGGYPDPFGFEDAPRFQIQYVRANGMQPAYEAPHFEYAPHDFQHLVRYTRSAKALAWLGNDSLAKDDLRMQAEVFHLSYHEYPNEESGASLSAGLRSQWQAVSANPRKGLAFGRGEGWGLDCMVAAYGLSDPAWRAAKRPWFQHVIQMLLEGQAECSGFIQGHISDKAVDGRYRARQQIEQSITENALQGLRESVFRGSDPGHAAMTREVLTDSLYAFISPMAWMPGQGPWRYTGIGPLDVSRPVWCFRSQMPGNAYTAGDYENYLNWSSFAYAFEMTGDPIFLEYAAEEIGGGALDQMLRQAGTDNIANRAALLALTQHRRGEL